MICPRCSVAEISPLTNRCELCGFAPAGAVAVEASAAEGVDEPAHHELGHLFHFDALLGVSADTAVYLARTLDSNQHLVLKVVRRPGPRRPDAAERFRRAVEAAAGLEHPHLVPVTGSGVTNSLFWYTMEHQRSHSLRVVLATRGPLDVRSTQRVVAQIGSALDYCHRRGYVHGDLKPENILIDPDGWVRVNDAIVARACDLPTAPEPAAARPAYTAPEDWSELMQTPSGDQWALAVLVHECLTGKTPPESGPFLHEPTAPLVATRSEPPIHIVQAVRRALSARPADRFPSVLDFVSALESPGRTTLTDARPTGHASTKILTIPGWQPPPRELPPLRPILTAAAVIGLIVTSVVFVPRLISRRQRPIYDEGPVRPAVTAPAPPVSATAESARTPPAPTASPPVRSQRRPRGEIRTRATEETPAAPPRTPQRTEPVRTAVPAAPAAAQETGRLSVSATPWGQLYLDGQLIGNTPKANLPVAAGTHTIRVVRDGFEPVERTVQIGAGQTVRVTGIVLAERRP